MKLFPHDFVPFFRPLEYKVAFTDHAKGKATEASDEQDYTFRKKPVIVDVERAVDVMIGSSAVKNDRMREQFRLAVIKALPADQIDWETINWVKLCPFRANRLQLAR